MKTFWRLHIRFRIGRWLLYFARHLLMIDGETSPYYMETFQDYGGLPIGRGLILGVGEFHTKVLGERDGLDTQVGIVVNKQFWKVG